MREAARFCLRQLGESDFASFYCARLDSGDDARRAAAVAGLGETGDRGDVPRVASHASDPDPRVRREVVVRSPGSMPMTTSSTF